MEDHSLAGTVISHYRIIEKLGEGGMGIVYKSEDLDLGRVVALKFLPRRITPTVADQKRFTNEARAAAVLNHPNVCTIYEIGREGDRSFISMEFVDGENLRSRMENSGPIGTDEAVEIARQIAEGLEAAHRAGITHRDVKPENIMITPEGQVKILDFGLAKLRGSAQLTQTGATTGTAAYMAPEQARGQKAGPAADVWGLGVILYEMLAGRRPFVGDYSQAVIYSILNSTPEPIGNVVRDVPANVLAAIDAALEKDPADRPASAGIWKAMLRQDEVTRRSPAYRKTSGPHRIRRRAFLVAATLVVLAGLGWLTLQSSGQAGSASENSSRISSLAVLPFQSASISEDGDAEAYAVGLTDALTIELSRLSDLRTISRSSVARFKNSSQPIPAIAGQLNVEGIVEGSIMRVGDQLEVTVSLVDAAADKTVWGETFSSDLSEFLDLKSRIAQGIADAAAVELSTEDRARLSTKRPVDPEAHAIYLKAVLAWNRQNVPGFEDAIKLYQEAIAIDPDFALAYAGLANVYLVSAHVHKPPYEAFPAAREAALRALEFDPASSEALAALADVIFHYDRNWEEAESKFREAIELNPGNSAAHWWYGGLLSALGRHEEALHEAQLAQSTDPLGFGGSAFAIRLLYYARRYDEAIDAIERFEENFPRAHPMWRDISILVVDPDSTKLAEIEQMAEVGPPTPYLLTGMARLYYRIGRHQDARAVLARLESLAEDRFISPYHFALVHAAFGDTDESFEYLREAETIRDALLPWVNVDPGFDPIRDEPRFAELIGRLDL